jgi:uncharacterized SAM-dependent methyltransferase
MINFRILNMTALATITCNSNILDVLNNKMNRNKQQLNMYSQNMINRQTTVHRMYLLFASEITVVTLLMIALKKTGRSRR